MRCFIHRCLRSGWRVDCRFPELTEGDFFAGKTCYGFDGWATHINVSIEQSMQIVWPKRIGQFLRPREVVDANNGIICHGGIDAR